MKMNEENIEIITCKINVKIDHCAKDIIRYLLENDISFNASYLSGNSSTISYTMPEEKYNVIFKEIEKFLSRNYTLQ